MTIALITWFTFLYVLATIVFVRYFIEEILRSSIIETVLVFSVVQTLTTGLYVALIQIILMSA